MTMLMALLLAAAGPDSDGPLPFADEPLPLTLASEEQQDPTRSRERDQDSGSSRRESGQRYAISLGIEGRWTLPFGYANREVYAVDNPAGGLTLLFDSHLRWNDVFNSGWGTSIVAEVTVMQAGKGGGQGRGRGNSSVGFYVAFSQDKFTGSTESDGRGNTIAFDDMQMNTYLVGGSVFQSLGDGFFTQGRAGLGAVHYTQTDAKYNFAFNAPFTGGFLDETWNFAMEVRGGGGYRIGPIAFTLGIGGRMLLPPNAAAGVSLDSGILWTFDIDLGVELGF
jgi:hypothetical protein